MAKKTVIVFAIILAVILVLFKFIHEPVTQTLQIGSVSITVEIADTLAAQARGLSGRESLCENCGMLFIYKEPRIQYFWMNEMRFPLDIIFIRDGKVVEIAQNVPVNDLSGNITRIQSREPADQVLEVNAGFVQYNRISIGFPLSEIGEGRVR